MKKIFFLLFLCCSHSLVNAQVQFREIRYREALDEAGKSGKLVFLQLDPGNCIQCSEVADKGLKDPKLGEFINQAFICLRITVNHPDREFVLKQFNKRVSSMGTLFIAADGSLVHSFSSTTSKSTAYEDEANKALSKSGEGARLKDLEHQYKEGNRSIGFLELYMSVLKSLEQPTDALLDEYVALLPDDSLSSFRSFLFVMSMTPVYESAAFGKISAFTTALNAKKPNSPIGLRPPAKLPIIHKSIRVAIARNDEAYAIRVANYAGSMYPDEPAKGEKEKAVQLMYYYDQLFYKEQTSQSKYRYLEIAADYYDRYFMTLSADSLHKLDTINMNNLRKKQTPVKEKRGDSVRMTYSIRYSPIAQSYANELSGAARRFLERSTDKSLLEKAARWAAKSVELFTGYPYMNIYALLLSKTGRKDEAIQWQEKAIALKKKQGMDPKNLEKELEEMK